MTARRCPPTNSSQRIGGPEVRIVRGVIPGTASPAGCTSTRTGSAETSRSSARAFASSLSIAALICLSSRSTPFKTFRVGRAAHGGDGLHWRAAPAVGGDGLHHCLLWDLPLIGE